MSEILRDMCFGVSGSGSDSEVMKVRLRVVNYTMEGEDGKQLERLGFIPYNG